MSKDAVLRLKSSTVFKALLNREIEDGFSNKLSSKIEIIVENVSDLLERIPENMPEYTLHDPNHSAKIVDIIGKFLPVETLQHLNSIELTLIILAAYLHDIGMTSSKEEKENIIADNEDYKILFKTLIDKKEKYEYYKSMGDHRSATFIEDQVFTEFLRRNHVNRSAEYIKANLSDGQFFIEINGIPFWKHLVTICNGHGVPVKKIKDTKIYPTNTLVGEKIINVQFLALILRLGDILDLDPERTPKIIYEFINPQDPISIIEWKKHRSIIGYSITSEKILFEAECSIPEVERALKEFMNWIEIERKQTMQLLYEYSLPSLKNYHLHLNEEISIDRIRSDGSYIYNDLKFEIDYQRVLEILMGQRLYRSTIFALRELLQNSCDAIKARQEIYANKIENFEAAIHIEIDGGKLIVKDNGIGMNFDIFRNYFLQIGKSYYSSPDFYSQYSEIDVTSEFGIGVLSVFMIANSLTLESRREPDNPINPPKPIYFEIPTAYSYTIQKEGVKIDIGTDISLKLKSHKPFKDFKLYDILSELIPSSPFPIYVTENGIKTCFKERKKDDISFIPPFINITNYEEFIFDDLNPDSNNRAFSHAFFQIDFSKSNNPILSNINGKLYLINSGKYNWYSIINGFICQRNFAIGTVLEDELFRISTTENTKKLFPNWLSYYSTLNLTHSACLTITPDRTDFINDDKYENLKTLIEEFIIAELQDHFEAFIKDFSIERFYEYMDFLLSTGFIGMDNKYRDSTFSDKTYKFLAKYISFPVITKEGFKSRLDSLTIASSNTIGKIYYKLNETHLTRLQDIVSSDAVIINFEDMLYNVGKEYRVEMFFNYLISGNLKIIGNYLIVTNMLPLFTIDIVKYCGKYNDSLGRSFTLNIIDSFKNEDTPILCLPKRQYEFYMTLNASHPLITAFLGEDLLIEKNRDKFIEQIQDLLSLNIEESIKRIGFAEELFWEKAFDEFGGRVNYFEVTNGLLMKDSLFLDAVNEGIRKLWQESAFILTANNTAPPVLSKNDFPRYWSDLKYYE
ncbi:HD domain-containing protein [Mucilaginibacter sp.]|uniref:HD domain-containing protein n=1 Tax=Mucilaginibacter sp. TaxID=1882438 RepID=UPI002ED5C313